MKYYEVKFILEPNIEAYADVFSASLAEIGFESFVPSDKGLVAYIQQQMFNEESLKQERKKAYEKSRSCYAQPHLYQTSPKYVLKPSTK